MAYLVVHRHGSQPGMQFIPGGCIQGGLADLLLHLLRQGIQHGAGVPLHFQLEIHKPVQIRIKLIRIFIHQLLKGFAGDVVRDNGPLPVKLGDLLQTGDVQPRFFHTSLIQRLVQDVRFFTVMEDLDHQVSIPINGLIVAQGNDSIQFHDSSSL